MKTVKSGTYEARLSEFGVTFDEHRKAIEMALSLHTAVGVDAANDKLDRQSERLTNIERKLDMIAVFRKLDTPRERDIYRFLEKNGGAKACISDDDRLEELILKSGELSVARISGKDTGRKTNDFPAIRKRLLKELQEDVDDAFARNMVLFERKLEMQNKQLNQAIQQESDYIITSLLAGAHDRITDPVSVSFYPAFTPAHANLPPGPSKDLERYGALVCLPKFNLSSFFTGLER